MMCYNSIQKEWNASLLSQREAEVGRYDTIPVCGAKDCVFGFYPLEVSKT